MSFTPSPSISILAHETFITDNGSILPFVSIEHKSMHVHRNSIHLRMTTLKGCLSGQTTISQE